MIKLKGGILIFKDFYLENILFIGNDNVCFPTITLLA